MRDITPERYRCAGATATACPAVFILPDGRYAVKGELVGVDGHEATVIVDLAMVIEAAKSQLWSED